MADVGVKRLEFRQTELPPELKKRVEEIDSYVHAFAPFLLAVNAMREAQKTYFRTRDRNVLAVSKELEADVDGMLLEYFGGRQIQLDFGIDGGEG